MRSRHPARVLAVDDDEASRKAMAFALTRFGHEVEVAGDAVEARARMRLGVSLVLADADMPGMDGFDLARSVRQDPEWEDIPILMVTGLVGRQHRLRAVEVGVNDFIAKPWDVEELFLRTEALLQAKTSLDGIKRRSAVLKAELARQEESLRRTLDDLAAAQRTGRNAHLAAVEVLVHAAEYKDPDTAAHVSRMRWYVDLLARTLGLPPRQVELLREGSAMHDVGKIGVPDAILLKPGPLTEEERRVMQGHTVIGARILEYGDADELRMGRTIALSHHERWDGKGYPRGWSGTDIPQPARICAVADVFDALTMDRCYRPALPNDQVVSMMKAERGRQFDPEVLDVFMDHLEEAVEIQARFRDVHSPLRPS